MPDPADLLLLDIFHLTLLMLGFGLLAYALIRRSNPLIRWHEHGNVWTDPYLKVDLIMLGVIAGTFYASIRAKTYAAQPSRMTDLDPAAIATAIVNQNIIMAVLIGGIIFVFAYVREVDVMELFGLTRLRASKVIFWSVAMLVLTLPVVIGVTYGWSHLLQQAFGSEPEQQELVTIMRESNHLPVKILIAISACLTIPIIEEILFRGYLYPAVKRYSERFFAAIVISLLFAVVHSNTMSVLPLFVLAMSFTLAYELTGCLLVPIAMHAMFNMVQVTLMFAPVPVPNG